MVTGKTVGIASLGSFDVACLPRVEIASTGVIDHVEDGTRTLATDAGFIPTIRAVFPVQTPEELIDAVTRVVCRVSGGFGVSNHMLGHDELDVRRRAVRKPTNHLLGKPNDLGLQAAALPAICKTLLC